MLFTRAVHAAMEIHGVAADIAFNVNTPLGTIKLLTQIRIQQLFYKEKKDLSELMGPAVSSTMVLPLR